MNPQPDPSTVVIVKRSYNSLKRQNDYKRRITWIESAPSTLKIKQKHLAIVEYIGIFPDEICMYGNSKSSNSEYVRTATDVMANIKEKVKIQKPREVYTTLTLNGSAPRDLKQVQTPNNYNIV
jgi:hypothetical protein